MFEHECKQLQETRRRQQIEAAERRANEQAARGIKDPERVKRNQMKNDEMERREQELRKTGGAELKVHSNFIYIYIMYILVGITGAKGPSF